jgi:hypothetical protein
MRIGILGAGKVGGTLGVRWARNGHSVVFASRSPESPEVQKLIAAAGASACSGSNAQSAAASEVIVLTTPWEAAQQVLKSAGDLAGKILIDATNPVPGLEGLSLPNTTSAAEKIAEWAPQAKVVKAFNTVGYNIMADPSFKDHKAAMFYCGDHADAKASVHGLINELGFDALDAGPLKQARVLEPFALLWISLAVKCGFSRNIAFELLRRPS